MRCSPPSRVAHVKGCETEAACLSRRWGADQERACEAAILHDITKKEDLSSQLQLCKKYGIIPDDVEATEGKLLHSKTGAAIANMNLVATIRCTELSVGIRQAVRV